MSRKPEGGARKGPRDASCLRLLPSFIYSCTLASLIYKHLQNPCDVQVLCSHWGAGRGAWLDIMVRTANIERAYQELGSPRRILPKFALSVLPPSPPTSSPCSPISQMRTQGTEVRCELCLSMHRGTSECSLFTAAQLPACPNPSLLKVRSPCLQPGVPQETVGRACTGFNAQLSPS